MAFTLEELRAAKSAAAQPIPPEPEAPAQPAASAKNSLGMLQAHKAKTMSGVNANMSVEPVKKPGMKLGSMKFPEGVTGRATDIGMNELMTHEPGFMQGAARLAIEVGAGVYGAGLASAPRAAALATRAVAAAPRVARAAVAAAPGVAKRVAVGAASGISEGMGSLVSELIDPSGNPVKAAITTGATGFVGEAALVPGFAKAYSKLREGGFALKEGARPVVQRLLKRGLPASPGFFSDKHWVQILDNVAAGSFAAGGKVKEIREAGARSIGADADNFIRSFKTYSDDVIDVENFAREIIRGDADAFRLTAKKKYGIIDEIVGGGYRVNVGPIEDALKARVKEFGGKSSVQPLLAEMQRLRDIGEIDALGTMSFETAADLRSGFLRLSRSGDELVSGKAAGLGKNIAPIVDRQMQEAIQRMSASGQFPGDDLLLRWREANAFWKEGTKTYNSRLIKAIAKDDPQALMRAIGDDPRKIRQVRDIVQASKEVTESGLTGPQVWKEMQGQMLTDAAAKSTSTIGDAEVLVGKKMVNLLLKKKEAFIEAFDKSGYDNAVKIFNELALAQGSAAETRLPGGIFIQLKQAQAAGKAIESVGLIFGYSSGLGPPEMAILAGPTVVANIMNSKPFTRWALLGLNPKTPPMQRIRAITQLMALGVKNGAEFIAAGEKETEPTREDAARAPLPAFLQGPSGGVQ
jgi:hypothetical protein